MKTDENPNPSEKTQPHQYVPEYEEFRQRKVGDIPLEINPEKSIRDWNKFFADAPEKRV